jgi:hypothetical protein
MFGQKVMIICLQCSAPLASSLPLLLRRVLALLSLPTPHTHKDRLPKQGKENNKELGQALTSSSCFQTTASNGLLHELLMAAQSGFFVAKHSTSTTILCTPPPQDALRQGEGHAGPAAQPRGGERAAL